MRRLALTGALALLLTLVLATAVAAQPDAVRMDRPRTEVLASDLSRTVVRLTFPVQAGPADWAAVDPARVVWWRPGRRDSADPGADVLPPAAGFGLALPGGTVGDWRVAGVRWWRDPDRPVAPADLVEVVPVAIYRGVALGGFRVPAASAGGVLAEITIAIDHPVPADRAAALRRVRDDARLQARAASEPVPPGLVNPDVMHRLRAVAMSRSDGAAKAGRGVEDWFGLSDHWVRLEVTAAGVYSVTGLDLAAWGVPTGDVDPAKLRVFRGGGFPLDLDPTVPDSLQPGRMGLVEMAVEVQDGGDGEWNGDDRVLFYGSGADLWTDQLDPAALPLDHYEHPFADHGVYWLTWEGFGTASPFAGEPQRIPTVARPAASGVPPTTVHWARYHGEESLAPVPGVVQDNWVWEKFIQRSEYQVPFQLQAVADDQPARLVVDVRTENRSGWTIDVIAWLNDDAANADSLSFSSGAWDDSLRIRLFGETTALRSGPNTLRLRNVSERDVAIMLDSFDLRYRQRLDKRLVGGPLFCQHWQDEVAAPGTQVNLQFTLAGGVQPRLWDISRTDAVVDLAGDLAGGNPAQLTVGLVRDPDTSRRLVLFEEGDLRRPAGERVQIVPLRSQTPDADYVVIYHPRFRDAALDLAALRGRVLPGVEDPVAVAVSVEDIYANFSGGNKDPLALRDYLRWLYESGGQRLRAACFLGDASRDYRNHLGADPEGPAFDLVPSWLQLADFPSGYQIPYSTDDMLVSFDPAPAGKEFDAPDLACGRLTVNRPEEARRLVDAIVAQSEAPDPGVWRNGVVFAADDEFQGGPGEGDLGFYFAHMEQAESLARNQIPAAIDLVKIYLTNYDFVGLYKPAGRSDLIDELNDGTTIFYYVGHGSTAQLADEQLFLLGDVPNLTNRDRRFLFCAFSCKVGVYDDPSSRSMAEVFVNSEGGGAIAAVAASRDSYGSQNDALSDAFFEALYPGRHVSTATTPGSALLLAKVAAWERSTFDYRNARPYLFFGDPGLRLPNPVDDLVFADTSADTLETGRRHAVRLDLAAQGLVPGAGLEYDLRVEESSKVVDVRFESLVSQWVREGGTVFRGTGPAADDELTIPFLAPLQMRYGQDGRIRLIVRDGPVERCAVLDSVPVELRAAGASDDVSGPRIELGVMGIREAVRPQTELTAAVTDSSGINILGSNPANSVLLEFDGTGIYTDVTERFVFDPGSYVRGTLRAPLPADLPVGEHEMVLLASDMVGNVGSDTLSFTLVGAQGVDVGAVVLYPNPTPGPCHLVCELSEGMTLQWDIYTVSGRRVRSLRRDFPAGGRVSLAWDGRDGEGDQIANGTYLYVLRGRGAIDAGHEVRRTGQLVIMR